MAIGWSLFLICICTLLYRHFQWRYIVADRRITSVKGIIGRQSRSINVSDLRNVNVNQNFVQRLLGIGDIEFSSSGSEGAEVVFANVKKPTVLADAVQEERRIHGASHPD